MRYTYAIKEIKPKEGHDVYDVKDWDIVPDTYQEIGEMSLHKLIKKLEAKVELMQKLNKLLAAMHTMQNNMNQLAKRIVELEEKQK